MEDIDDLTLDEIATLRDLGSSAYVDQVISLFVSGRARQHLWLVLGEAIQYLSESSHGGRVAEIDRAILCHLQAQASRR
jgi:hypothetical protein